MPNDTPNRRVPAISEHDPFLDRVAAVNRTVEGFIAFRVNNWLPDWLFHDHFAYEVQEILGGKQCPPRECMEALKSDLERLIFADLCSDLTLTYDSAETLGIGRVRYDEALASMQERYPLPDWYLPQLALASATARGGR